MATPKERNTWDTLERIKDKVEALIVQMENALVINPTPMSALQRRIKNTEKAWTEFKGQYDRLRAIAGDTRPSRIAPITSPFSTTTWRCTQALRMSLTVTRTQKTFAPKRSLPNRKCSSTPPDGRELTTALTGPWRRSRPAWRAPPSTA